MMQLILQPICKVTRRGERVQKHLAALGISSRRAIDQWLARGQITIDDRVAAPGDTVDARSRICIDGRRVRRRPRRAPRVILYHKPEGEITTRADPRGRPTVFRRLPKLPGQRWVAVGRLDINTRGLLLFTTDGDLANRLMHPRARLEREYLCRVFGRVDERILQRLCNGVCIDGETMRFCDARRHSASGGGRNNWYSVIIARGKYREVRKLWDAVGCRLSRLIRVRYGEVMLPRNLKPGQWREMSPRAIAKLMQCDASAHDDNLKPAKPPAKSSNKSRDVKLIKPGKKLMRGKHMSRRRARKVM